MDRLPWSVTKLYYDALDIEFEKYNEAQFNVVKSQDRFPLIIGGERGGKSFSTAAIMLPHIDMLPEIRKERFYDENGNLRYKGERKALNPDFVLFGPSYAEPRIEFSYLEDWLRQLDNISFTSKPQEGPWRLVTKTGVVVATWSTDDPAGIRAIDLEGAAACECGNMEWEAVERIQGRIGAKKGFCIYSGTMENAKRWYVKMALEGERQNRYGVKTYSLPSWENKSQFPGGYDDPEIQRWATFYGGVESETFMVRVAAKAVPPRDRVIREIKEKHIRKVEIPRKDDGTYDAHFELCIDPGYLPSAYAVLFVASWDTPDGKFWYIFDEIYKQETQNEQIIELIKKHRFYRYMQADDLTIDVSAKRHADGNEPAIEKFKKLTKFRSPYTKYWHEASLIERIRTTANQGLLAIHPNCQGLIAELGLGEEVFPEMHPWRYPTDKGGIILNEKPVDKWNHSCKALGYLLLRRLGPVERASKSKPFNRINERLSNERPRFSIFSNNNKRGS